MSEDRGAVLLRVRLLESGADGRRWEQDWLAAAQGAGWERELGLAAARAGAEQRVSRSDPSLASLEREELTRWGQAPALCEWIADRKALADGGGGELAALDWLAQRALESLAGALGGQLGWPLPGRWSDRLLESASGGACAELEAWRAIGALLERRDLSEQTRYEGDERRSKDRGGL